ncbi:MAG: (R)-specific enoyl-CoA hydratase [Alphaproteobacteria bacterium MarineAlpha3_Bin1]|jgi:3-hydroxybutyryl-CoA dehydratase|nr:MAG: (R)-specific enoyl-CoA hydratase [Alphaproteobacteria bacterium MarineAlpha3_Bin1]
MQMEQAREAKRVKEANELLHGLYFEDIEEGMKDAYAKTITNADIITFAGISGDTNPVHLNHEFASETMFEGQIAHGMLTASFISTVIGTKLPGPGCIYVSQNLRFKAPVKVGDTVTATCTVRKKIPEKHMIEMETVCSVGGKPVLDGDATILVPLKANKA